MTLKILLLDNTLSLNGAAYTYKVTGLQVTKLCQRDQHDPQCGSVKIYGAEGDFNYRTPLAGLDVHGAAAFNHAIYTSFVGAPCYKRRNTGRRLHHHGR